jgi:hypothetical protein
VQLKVKDRSSKESKNETPAGLGNGLYLGVVTIV